MMSRGARGGRAVHTSTTGRMPCSRGAASALAVIAILVSWLGGSELGAASELASLMEPAEIRVTFPQLDEVASPFAGAAKVNEAIHARALPLVTELAAIGSVWGEYEVHLERGSLISVTMQYSGYGRWMAHPMHLRTSVTADAETGEIYSLKDLFADDSYIQVLSEAVAAGLRERNAEPLFPFEGIVPDHGDFYLTPTSLVVYFQLYDLLPYVYGFPEFEVPLAAVASIAAPGGPIARLLEEEP